MELAPLDAAYTEELRFTNCSGRTFSLFLPGCAAAATTERSPPAPARRLLDRIAQVIGPSKIRGTIKS